jgi:hypothetical protein
VAGTDRRGGLGDGDDPVGASFEVPENGLAVADVSDAAAIGAEGHLERHGNLPTRTSQATASSSRLGRCGGLIEEVGNGHFAPLKVLQRMQMGRKFAKASYPRFETGFTWSIASKSP